MKTIRDIRDALKPSAPLWSLPFRPFFLVGSLYATLSIGTWLLFLTGKGFAHLTDHDPLLWHGHEMLFGFVMAIVAGFLGTASRNWSGVRSMFGARLIATSMIWLVGRMAFLGAGVLPHWSLAVELVFLPTVLAVIFPQLKAAGRRNLPFLAILSALWICDLLIHLQIAAVVTTAGRAGLYAATFLVIALIAVIGGRVLPFFTSKRLALTEPLRVPLWLDVVAILSLVPVAVFVVLFKSGPIAASFAFLSAVLHGLRLAAFFKPGVLREPMLWVLYLGYGWVVVGMLALGAQLLTEAVPITTPLHAFTAGAMGVMIYGMIPRVSLGHTGRPIRADAWLIGGFLTINVAAAIRVAWPAIDPSAVMSAWSLSGALWSLAFLILFARIAPWLMAPRADGRPL